MSLKSLQVELGPLYKPEQAAEFLGCTPSSVRKMCAAGELSPINVTYRSDGQPRYGITEQAIKKWRRDHEVRTS